MDVKLWCFLDVMYHQFFDYSHVWLNNWLLWKLSLLLLSSSVLCCFASVFDKLMLPTATKLSCRHQS